MTSFCKSIVLLLVCGVFGAVTDKEEPVSVNEGESVSLLTHVTTELQNKDKIRWRFGEEGSVTLITEMTGEGSITYKDLADGRFKDRLQILDLQTGDLIIKNIKHKHSGRYKVDQESTTKTTYKIFRVTVNDAPRVIGAEQSDVKSARVIEGDSVTLHTDVQTQRYDLILWRFGEEGVLLAKEDKEDNKSSIYDDALDGMFRDRLKLDDQTGSLIITNTKTTDTGVYKLQIINNRDSKYKTFSVSVRERDLSAGLLAGIISGVLLVIAAVGVIAVIAYRGIKYEQQKQKVKEMIVLKGDPVTVDPDVTKLQSDDVIEWRFRDEVIATFNKDNSDEERLIDRLQVDVQTGSLTITDIRTEDAGLYKVKIISSSGVKSFLQFITGGGPSYYQFNVIVTVWEMENYPVTLNTGVTKLQSHDVIQWRFGETLIAEINGKNNKISTHDVLDEIFKDRLNLDDQTGDLTIRDLNTEHTGHYKLKIINSRGTSYSQNKVIVEERIESVRLGGSVTLMTDVTGIQTDDKIQWTFGDEETLKAQMTVGTEPSYDSDKRFRNRLKMNTETGDLTITSITAELTGVYRAKISSSRGTKYRTYRLNIWVNAVRKTSVTLQTDSKIQTGDEIKWIYDYKTCLATGKFVNYKEINYTDNVRFKDRLKMKPETGDLTITNIRWTDRGLYTLKISSDGKISYRIFNVFVSDCAFQKRSNQPSDSEEIEGN